MVQSRKNLYAFGWAVLLSFGMVGCRNSTQTQQGAQTVPAAATVVNSASSAPTPTPTPAIPLSVGTPINPPRMASLTAEEADAQVNLRSQPSTEADSLGYGVSGNEVYLLQLVEGEGGYTWYYAKFVQSETEGWVRGDFIATKDQAAGGTGSTAVSTANCGSDKQEAFFETKTFLVYICDAGGSLRYVGTDKQTQQSLVLNQVVRNQGTYVAINGDYQYHINDGTLAMYQVKKGEYTQLDGEQVIKFERAQ
ncbi:MAG TPA: SH3 domain-containing protein [Trichocoleus sp.]